MKVVYSAKHLEHLPQVEFYKGKEHPHGDNPDRVEKIIERLQRRYEIVNGRTHADFFIKEKQFREDITRVHDPAYVNFLESIKHDEQVHKYNFNRDTPDNKMTPLSKRTANAAMYSAYTALTGAEVAIDHGDTFALTRPPGHHAGFDYSKGICYLNNAVIAATYLMNKGYSVSILDFDLHAPDGTLELAERFGLRVASLHENPDNMRSYVRNRRHVEENTEHILNLPLDDGVQMQEYLDLFSTGMEHCKNSEVIVVSAGFDISPLDRRSRLGLNENVFIELGRMFSDTPQKKLFVLEGGYYSPPRLAGDIADFLEAVEGKDYSKNPVRVSVIYHSETGNTKAMAFMVNEGCDLVDGIESKVMPINNVDTRFLRDSQAIIFGAPTQYGTVSWQMKRFLDEFFEHEGIFLEGKLGAAFSTANSMGGGSEHVIDAIHDSLLCYGMMVYSGGSYKGRPYNHFGAVARQKPEGIGRERAIKLGQNVSLHALSLFKR